jgi:hypothetical protein
MPDLRHDREQRRVIIHRPLSELRRLCGSYPGDEDFRWTPTLNGAIGRYLELWRVEAARLRDEVGEETLARIVARELPEILTEAERRIVVGELRMRAGEQKYGKTTTTLGEAMRVVAEI